VLLLLHVAYWKSSGDFYKFTLIYYCLLSRTFMQFFDDGGGVFYSTTAEIEIQWWCIADSTTTTSRCFLSTALTLLESYKNGCSDYTKHQEESKRKLTSRDRSSESLRWQSSLVLRSRALHYRCVLMEIEPNSQRQKTLDWRAAFIECDPVGVCYVRSIRLIL